MVDRITDLERRYVEEVLDTGFRSSSGSVMTGRLEQAFAARYGVPFAISFVNGTATLHAALVAAGVGPGHEVIVPPLTMSSTAMSVVQAGAVPVFADVDPDTFTMSPASVQACVTERTKAVMPVALYGLAPDLDPIMEVAHDHDLFVLEDDAQCFLGTYHGRLVGTIGHASSFSFQSSKHLTGGEGGMIVTADGELAARIRRFGSLGYQAVAAGAGKGKIRKQDIQDPAYERHSEIGWNYRLPELCAAVILAQVERMDELVEPRMAAGRLFRQAVEPYDWVRPQAVPDGYGHAYWTFVIALDTGHVDWHRFRDELTARGGHGVYGAWQLSHLEPVFRGQRFGDHQWQELGPGLCPVAEDLQPRLVQFKTNYLGDEAVKQAEVLAETLQALDRG
jgi:perosamine synthetase